MAKALFGHLWVFIWRTHCPNLFVQRFLAHITQSFLWSKWCNITLKLVGTGGFAQAELPKGSALHRFPQSKAMMMWLPCWACHWPLGNWPPTITGLFAPCQWTGGPDWWSRLVVPQLSILLVSNQCSVAKILTKAFYGAQNQVVNWWWHCRHLGQKHVSIADLALTYHH